MDEGRAMRVMKTTPPASLDTGKEQGNRSLHTHSWGSSEATYCGVREERGRSLAISQSGLMASDQFRRWKDLG